MIYAVFFTKKIINKIIVRCCPIKGRFLVPEPTIFIRFVEHIRLKTPIYIADNKAKSSIFCFLEVKVA
jgi:hypothetical protein